MPRAGDWPQHDDGHRRDAVAALGFDDGRIARALNVRVTLFAGGQFAAKGREPGVRYWGRIITGVGQVGWTCACRDLMFRGHEVSACKHVIRALMASAAFDASRAAGESPSLPIGDAVTPPAQSLQEAMKTLAGGWCSAELGAWVATHPEAGAAEYRALARAMPADPFTSVQMCLVRTPAAIRDARVRRWLIARAADVAVILRLLPHLTPAETPLLIRRAIAIENHELAASLLLDATPEQLARVDPLDLAPLFRSPEQAVWEVAKRVLAHVRPAKKSTAVARTTSRRR